MYLLCRWFICFSLLIVILLGMMQVVSPVYAQPPSALDTEATIDRLVEISKQLQAPGLRGQHPKGHGTVWVEFTVAPDLPEDLRVGVFRQPGKTYPAWIRFSNGRVQDDTQPGLHGMAIKLMGVTGEKVLDNERNEQTQDFLLGDSPIFFARNAQDFLEFFEALAQSDGKPPLKFFFSGVNPLKWRVHELMVLRSIQQIKIANPLAVQYWSQTPYQFGSEAAKFSVRPTSQINGEIVDTPDYLRSAMANYLKDQDATFEFLIQRQTNPDTMPIDDPTIEWNEQESPFQKVATIRIPQQVFDSPEQMAFGENLSFTPWHSLPEHQPLGSINLARRAVYQSLSEERHEQTGMMNQEPTPEAFAPQLLN